MTHLAIVLALLTLTGCGMGDGPTVFEWDGHAFTLHWWVVILLSVWTPMRVIVNNGKE